MKKIISIFLCATLLISIIPVAFAADYTPAKEEYKFRRDALGQTQSIADSAIADYTYDSIDTEKSKSQWEWYATSASSTYRYAKIESSALTFQINCPCAVDGTECTGQEIAFTKTGYAFKLQVDKSGVYTPALSYGAADSGIKTRVYLVDTDDFTIAKKQRYQLSLNADTMNSTYASALLGTVDMYTSATNSPLKNIELEAGDYYLIIAADGKNEAATAKKNNDSDYRWNMGISGFALSEVIPSGVEITCEKTQISRDGSTKVSATATYDGGITSTAVTYSSSDDTVATVDPVTGEVEGIGKGTATITATAGGVSDSVDITVTTSFTVKYDLKAAMSKLGMTHTNASGSPFYKEINYNLTNNFFRAVAGSSQNNSSSNIRVRDNALELGSAGKFIAFEVNVPATDVYTMQIKHAKGTPGGNVNVYAVPGEYARDDYAVGDEYTIDETKLIGSYNCNADSPSYLNGDAGTSDVKNVSLNKGTYVFVFKAVDAHGSVGTFSLIGDEYDGTIFMGGAITAGKTALTVGEDTTATVAGYKSDATVDTTATCSAITSSDESVITVSGENVTAVGAGKANLVATVNGETVTREITVSDKAVASVTYATTTSIDEANDLVISSSAPGFVTVEAPDKSAEGYTFSHWVQGTAAKGTWVSSDPIYNFNLTSNTYLTAVYTNDADKIVEFFNGTGELIAQKTVVDGSVEEPAKPTMIGFDFLRWITAKDKEFLNENITATLTRVVAEFAVKNDTFSVNGVSGKKYDEAIEIPSASGNEVAWYRDDVLVGYGTSYKYNVWDAVGKIEEKAIVGSKQPIVVLDKTVKTDDDGSKAYMIEFDSADKQIVEVGILFAENGTPTVDSCMYKATSQKNGSGIHGQFTAKPANASQTVVRGYLIYKDGDTYRVIYSR